MAYDTPGIVSTSGSTSSSRALTLASTFAYRVPTGLSLAATPALAGWLARVEARPSWQLAAEPIRAFLAGIAFNRH